MAGALAFAATALAGATARADVKKECAAAYEGAQEERKAGRLTAAREHLLVCAQDACPAVARKDCVTWLGEVDASLPTVVVEARGDGGADVADVRVLADGRVVKESLDGKAFPLDPGAHVLRFELARGPVKEERIIAREGEKNRRVVVSFATSAPPPESVTPAPPADAGGRGLPVAAIVAGGIGLVGVAGYATFGLLALGERSDLEKKCAPSCSDAQVAPIKTKVVLADVSLGVGVAGLGLATVLFLTSRPSKPAAAGARMHLVATPVPRGATAALFGSF